MYYQFTAAFAFLVFAVGESGKRTVYERQLDDGTAQVYQVCQVRCRKFTGVGPFTSMNGQNDIGMNNTNTIKKNDQDHDRKGDSESVREEQTEFKIGKG